MAPNCIFKHNPLLETFFSDFFFLDINKGAKGQLGKATHKTLTLMKQQAASGTFQQGHHIPFLLLGQMKADCRKQWDDLA